MAADQPETRYARAPDGGYIAYQTLGNGPRDIVLFGSSWQLFAVAS